MLLKLKTTDHHNISICPSVCTWIGVTCGARHHRVTALKLSSMGRIGTIPPHIGNLFLLSGLSFANNSFHGSFLPIELAGLRRLRYISLEYNSFSGQIPSWLGDLSQLQDLGLYSNNFIGGIPTSLCNLSKLEMMYLSNKSLRGSIPEAISNLHNLLEGA
ncbi:LRR receptor-like serine/threonine-protein kinase EFR [Tripterygium wilfordii]|uniref:LRR receptor-like serine/threonine-protein kinase EFR n=1 Tax=Tripterygium wilfordii TaxID=458696 RepID=UPI0018F8142D|nr:LRR receptor-like serine/threonine-protein kinase EFR [Tripterygium wilfordii]